MSADAGRRQELHAIARLVLDNLSRRRIRGIDYVDLSTMERTMQTKSLLFMLALAAATATAGVANAADLDESAKNPPDKMMRQNMPDKGRQQGGMMQGGGMMHGGMMQGGGTMGGMMGMMDRCAQMMGGSTSAHLPPGNEKLELQMQAEIMQKTGEILAKYADRIGADAKRTP
jgi:hypothetical protein